MICKWCGETIKAGAKTCKRCKHEIPAKSDCGGFYDLVPLPGTIPPAAPAPVAPPPAMPEPAPYGAAAPERNPGTLNSKIMFGGVIAVFLILLVMVIFLSGKLTEANERIAILENKCSDKKDTSGLSGFDPTDNTETTDPSDPPEPSDPTDPSDPPEPSDPTDLTDPPDATDATVTIKDGSGKLTFRNGLCEKLADEPVLIKVADERGNELAVISIVLEEGAEDSRKLTVDVEKNAEGCEIDAVGYTNAANESKPDKKHPGESYLLKADEEANITCTLTGTYENKEPIKIEITDIEIQ